MFGTFNRDKTHYACICRRCGQLQIKDKSEDVDSYTCTFCYADDLLVTSMKPSDAQREKDSHRWLQVLARYFTPEEIEQIKAQTFADTPESFLPRKKGIPVKDNDCVPSCPTCHSTDIKRISNINRATSIYLWGLLSSKINKQFVCKNCGYKW